MAPISDLGTLAEEITALDGKLNALSQEGKGMSDPEWSRTFDRLTTIGEELNAEGGEALMQTALQLAVQKGSRSSPGPIGLRASRTKCWGGVRR
ncbi:hypothetical protein E3T54_16570 [Cryobacterium sp. Sr8]|uniref:hypothetical protein n=1 Tax=Cryobacterium sp. Sr8 TaxID=1259203 RepID=UPI00106957C8|nr:hypothetical protein [Cryobacterium sp. Sr8]TFD73390.1 hypothetical protein E3T54_16570 [Cryobacterium sp. Sr8]